MDTIPVTRTNGADTNTGEAQATAATPAPQTQDTGQVESPPAEGSPEFYQKYNSREEIKNLPEDHWMRQTLRNMDKDYTEKTTALSAQRKELEQYQQVKPLIEGLQQNPVATIRALASQVPELAGTFQQPAQEDPLAKIKEVVPEEEIGAFQTLLDQATAPLKQQIQNLNDQLQLTRFGTENTDYKELEPDMAAMVQKLPPPNGQVTQEYLQHIKKMVAYDREAANREKLVADRVQQELARLNKTPQTSDTSPGATTSDSQVSHELPKDAGWQKRVQLAFEAVKKGVQFHRPSR